MIAATRRLTLCLCCLWALGGPSGCDQGSTQAVAPDPAAAGQDQPAHGDTLVDASIGDASNLLAILATDSASHQVSDLIFDGLVEYDAQNRVVGRLAESWEISPDGLELTFHLHADARFHDGRPVTAEDVAFSYRAVTDPATLTAYRGDFDTVERVEVTDPHTFKAVYREPFAPALISWSLHVLPRHLLEGTDLNASPLGRHPVGSGPFRFVEWQTGQRIVLERNPDYFRFDIEEHTRLPYLDRYVFRVIPDQGVQFNELLAGRIDLMTLKPLQWARQTDGERFTAQYVKHRFLANGYTYLGYNLRRKLFQDVRVRRAITHAIDRDELLKGVLLGFGEVASGPYKPGSWAHNPAVHRYPYDPERARTLLAEAGWTDADGDGIVERDGQPFRFTVLTNQGNDQRIKSAEIIQQRLAGVGIDMEIRVLEWAAFINDFVKPGNFDAVILGWNILPDPDLFDVWHSSKAGAKGLNHTFYRNAEVDDLLQLARRTFDQEERRRLYYRFQEILAEDQPYTFLFVPHTLVAASNRLHGIEPAPAGIRYNLPHWYVPKGRQRYAEAP